MQFRSYAQNFEDVMLWRCFKDLVSGFYLDVGAHDPVQDSVTKAFDDLGWQGINIEPTKSMYDRLREMRPNDLNLNIAVGDSESVIDFWEVESTGLSTGIFAFAKNHINSGHEVKKIQVPQRTLNDVLRNMNIRDINFMKIDVEGFERKVLLGLDLHQIRPQIILVEATIPNSQVENYSEWEPLILDNQYKFVYTDGLNRFYLAQEHQNLEVNFRFPPNVFDNFVKIDTSKLIKKREIAKLKTLLLKENNSNSGEKRLTDAEIDRVLMTVSCTDADNIPKTIGAGSVNLENGIKTQKMHNGLRIIEGCYYGPWMTHIIKNLKGHHEPQEELAFHEVLLRLKNTNFESRKLKMLELGSFWAYYSMWFLKDFPNSITVCIEPDPNYLAVGRKNFEINGLSGEFIQGHIGLKNDKNSLFHCESNGEVLTSPEFNFRGITELLGFSDFDLVLADIQGAEIELLKGMKEVKSDLKLRFILLSTHDMEISGSPVTHQNALTLLEELGAFIITEHSVSESYSGDGFILASFHPSDKDLNIDFSYNRSKNSLFGEWEPRLEKILNSNTHAVSESEINDVKGNLLIEEIEKLNTEKYKIMNSRSWKITRPLRLCADFYRKARNYYFGIKERFVK